MLLKMQQYDKLHTHKICCRFLHMVPGNEVRNILFRRTVKLHTTTVIRIEIILAASFAD